jgi:hypothetical protein
MAEIFRENGYQTGLFGKWHLGDHYPQRPEDRGFGEVVSFGDGGIGTMGDYWDNDYFNAHFRHNGKMELYEGHCTDIWFDEAIRFIRESESKPFFCYIPTNVPHAPFIAPPEYEELYRGKFGAPFYGMITHLDENLGRLNRFLDEEGLADNTILIYTSDNGTAGGVNFKEGKDGHDVIAGYNAGMRGKKGSHYDGGHRVPFFIRWPRGGITGGRVDALCAHLDVLPTLIELCDLKSVKDLSLAGISFSGLLNGKDDTENYDNRIIVETYGGIVMTPEWRLVDSKELYNIKKDPQQINDVAAEHPDRVKQLRDELERVNKVNVPYTQFIHVGHNDDWIHLNYEHWLGFNGSYKMTPVCDGEPVNHPYQIKVAREGFYEFELRRWPYSIDASFDDIVSVKIFEHRLKPKHGRKMNVVKARLQTGEFVESVPVYPGMKKAVFRVRLKTGIKKVNTWLYEADGKEPGAYFMDVRYLGQ